MSHRVAPCGGFDGEVEKVPASGKAAAKFGRFWRESAQREIQPQIGRLSLRFGCRIKAGGCKRPSAGSQQPAMRTAIKGFTAFRFFRFRYT